jgi:hypothetical protein
VLVKQILSTRKTFPKTIKLERGLPPAELTMTHERDNRSSHFT